MTPLLLWLCPILTSKATKNHQLFYVMYCVTAMFLLWMNMRVAQIQERLTLLFYHSGLGRGTWAQKTDELHYRPPFQVIWCSMHSSSELNSGEDTSVLSSEKDCISIKTFYTVISWQTTTAQAIRSPLTSIQHMMANTTVIVQGFPPVSAHALTSATLLTLICKHPELLMLRRLR